MPRPVRNNTFKIWLEPGIDATLRRYCEETGVSINAFVRYAIGSTLTTMTKADARDVPTQKEIYGRLSEQAITLRLSPYERRCLEAMAGRLLMERKRSYARLVRYCISRACRQISFSGDDSHREQSPALACEGSPPP